MIEAYSSARSSFHTSPPTLFEAMCRIASALSQGIVHHAPPQALVARPSLQQIYNHIRTKTGHVTFGVFAQYWERYLWTPTMRKSRITQKQ